MSKQQEITEFLQNKKIKQHEESYRLTTPIESDNENDSQFHSVQNDSLVEFYGINSTMKFISPFSQVKTNGYNSKSEIFPTFSRRLTFKQSPNKTLIENSIENQIRQFSDKKEQDLKQSVRKLRNGTLDDWVYKKEKSDTWPYLPKEVIYKIFSFLQLRDCANASLVCKFWKVCYHNIYFTYSFLRDFDTDKFSEREIATVFKKAGSKMKHIRKIRDMLKGQKIGPIMQKARLSAKLSTNSSQKGSLLEAFRLEPKRAGLSTSVFLTDKSLQNICSESLESLQFMSLSSCQFVTGKGFEGLRKCYNLQYLNIQNNSHLQDQNLEVILSELKNLDTLMLVKCCSLTSRTISIITDNCQKLNRLDLGCNQQIKFDRINSFSKFQKLGTLSLRQTSITNQEIQDLLLVQPELHSLNLSGCLCLNNLTLGLLRQNGKNLRRLNITCISYFSENDIYEMVLSLEKLGILLINNNLLSQQIRNIISERNI